jgi:hypothetical protein
MRNCRHGYNNKTNSNIMIIALNYAIFALAAYLSVDLFRRAPAFREAATHMALFAVAALLGGFAHHMDQERAWIISTLNTINTQLPTHFKLGSFHNIFIRVWLATFLAIGLTEYYFMRIFLHPLAEQYGFRWLKACLLVSLCVFSAASLFISQYSLVVTFHLLTHILIIGFSLYLIIAQGLKQFWQLIFLVALNLTAGATWSLMALGEIPTGPLHYNDWYHIIILVFLLYLHWALTKGRLVETLAHLNKPGNKEHASSLNPLSAPAPQGD